MNANVKERNSSIELLKIIAMILITFSHSTSRTGVLLGGGKR